MANTCKYQKLQRYVSYDSGATWQPLNEFQRGALIEADSPDCGGGTIFYRWVEMPSGTSYVCVGYDKYTKEKKQQSYDNVNWEDVVPAEYRQGTLIEHNSEDCGFVPPQPTGNTKWITYYSGGTYLTGECDSTSAITSQNCPPNYNGNNPCIELIVGDCVTTIRIQSWSQGQFMYVSSVTLSNSVTTLDVGAFEHFSGLTSIVIPDSVTTIGDLAFYLCTSLSSVTIGYGVTSIGDASFNRCNLDEIVIPNNVVTIGEQAFCNSGIKSATIGSGVTSIGGDAFSQNPNLSSVTITALVPPTLESYGVFDYTNDCPIFVPCDSLSIYKSANRWSDYSSRLVGIPPCGEIQYRWYPSGYTCIGYDKWQNNIKQQSTDGGETWTNVSPPEYSASTLIEADSEDCGYVPPTPVGGTKWVATYSDSHTESAECDSSSAITSGEIDLSGLTSVILNDCVITIGNNSFQFCRSLTSVTIPSSVTTIGSYAFEACVGLTSVTIPNSVTSIGDSAFGVCSGLTSIIIPNSVTSIGLNAFWDCRSSTSVTISNNVTSIKGGTFAYCEALTSVTIPNSVTTIGKTAFKDCITLSSVTIGSGVTSIGNSAFSGSSSLTSVIIEATTPPSLGNNAFLNTAPNLVIYVPAQSVSAYQSAWSSYASRIQAIPNS